MHNSYILPKPKYLVSKLSKIWIFYLILSFGVVFGLVWFVKNATKHTNSNATTLETQELIYRHEISRLQVKTTQTLQLIKEAKKRLDYNDNVKDILRGLLNIVPDSITISSVEMGQQNIVIKGKTPSKEAFYFLFQNKLNSMFDYSQAEFFPLSDGWYNFVSTSSSNTALIKNP
ncbi:hypothetical protein [Helicobacter cetorum]|uniref:hypothetical protein n=1 Tax=Helicobacter cetorum TaxID=138563 RepID=UPI000CF1B5ED|nr:hypothetical protein [Helicobacter cetorum]